MPNWCENELLIKGKKNTIREFKKAAKGANGILDAESFIPMPESEKDNWYEWRIKHWGTKWNFTETKMHKVEENIEYSFNTAWSPPIKVVAAMAKRFPELHIELKFWEMGAAYQGTYKWKEGRLIYELKKEYTGYRGG